ncbi:MAG: hypothetical protein BRC33_01000 [Cyanobacteria bacterium SW_9_44_58]|nr:MAG: hypothetical protein BRC33_01000 [Cyanobacteria bacterium SW_9_44_58]
MIEINLNSIIEVSLLVTFLSVLPWIGVFTGLKLMIHYVENVSCFLEKKGENPAATAVRLTR